MQEIHSIEGARFFAGDRRLRPHHHNHQALKCPRCDSLNTKFCYYNNYNLSQPRHFCKNCRRYWTKGGVLRNVPVGGGCRKSKRSNNPKPSNPPSSNSRSSSESSTLTAAATDALSVPSALKSDSTTTTTNTAAATTNNNNMQESKLLIPVEPSSNPVLETNVLDQNTGGDCGGIFSEIGNFTSLITSTNEALPFGFSSNGISDTSSFPWQHHKAMSIAHEEELKLPENLGLGAGSLLDHTVDYTKSANGGFGSLDWNGGAADQGLFDLPNTVDHAYWNHTTTDWSDQDNSTLFHLP